MTGPSKYKRLLADPIDGWLACMFSNNLMFIKTYYIDYNKKYGGITCFTASIWHFEDEIYEIEVMGPQERIEPRILKSGILLTILSQKTENRISVP